MESLISRWWYMSIPSNAGKDVMQMFVSTCLYVLLAHEHFSKCLYMLLAHQSLLTGKCKTLGPGVCRPAI